MVGSITCGSGGLFFPRTSSAPVRDFGAIWSYTGVKMDTADPPTTEVERLYREDGRRLWWALLGYCGDPEIASDALAEAFAQLLRRGDAVHAPARWVWRAAFRIATGELDRRRTTVAMTVEESYEIDEPSEVLAALARACLRASGPRSFSTITPATPFGKLQRSSGRPPPP